MTTPPSRHELQIAACNTRSRPTCRTTSIYSQVISGLAGGLPDMEFVVNCLDEPRVLLGEGTAAQRMHTSCRGASQVPSRHPTQALFDHCGCG